VCAYSKLYVQEERQVWKLNYVNEISKKRKKRKKERRKEGKSKKL
jgi:hypothetical protein